jgi:hypothetical protein
MTPAEYVYLGDRLTAPELRGMHCSAVRRADGKCIRSRPEPVTRKSMGCMLVEDMTGQRFVVVGRLLRKVKR